MSTYRLTDDDRETLSLIDRHFPEPRSRLTALVAAVEAIIAPIHARAEEAEAAGAEVARQMLLQVEAHRARAEAAEKRAVDAALQRDNWKERAEAAEAQVRELFAIQSDWPTRPRAIAARWQDRALAAEKRADDLAAVIDRVRERLARALAVWGGDPMLRDLCALLPDDTKETDQ